MPPTDVKLPKGRLPVWPQRCVRCSGAPTTTFRVSTHAIGWWTALFAFGAKFVAEPPACEPCRARMRTQRILRFGLMLALIAIATVFAVRWVGEPRGLRVWLVALVALGLLVPWFLWQALVPPPIELTAYSEFVDYEFADADYAAEFAALNDGELD